MKLLFVTDHSRHSMLRIYLQLHRRKDMQMMCHIHQFQDIESVFQLSCCIHWLQGLVVRKDLYIYIWRLFCVFTIILSSYGNVHWPLMRCRDMCTVHLRRLIDSNYIPLMLRNNRPSHKDYRRCNLKENIWIKLFKYILLFLPSDCTDEYRNTVKIATTIREFILARCCKMRMFFENQWECFYMWISGNHVFFSSNNKYIKFSMLLDKF
jgi:hypothetical protein